MSYYDPVAVMVNCIDNFIIWFGQTMSFSVAVKLAKIFEQEFKSNQKVQVSASVIRIGRPNVNKIDPCLITILKK